MPAPARRPARSTCSSPCAANRSTSSRWRSVRRWRSSTRTARSCSTTGASPAKPGWQEIDRLAERLGATVVTRTSGPPQQGREPEPRARHVDRRLRRHDRRRPSRRQRSRPPVSSRWFDDPGVGFVSAAQRFDAGRDVLNNRERFFFDWIQPAKDAAGCAISCGSGVAYRRARLDDIGGFSEWNVVEDLHTSYRLHAAGWTSVYEREAVTTGLAPRDGRRVRARSGRGGRSTPSGCCSSTTRCAATACAPDARLHYLQTTGRLPPRRAAGPVRRRGRRSTWACGSRRPAARPSVSTSPTPSRTSGCSSPSSSRCSAAATPSTSFRSTVFGSPIVGCRDRPRARRRPPWRRDAEGRPAPAVVARRRADRRSTSCCWRRSSSCVFDSRPGVSVVAVTWAAINTYLLIGPLAALSERETAVRRYGRIGQSSVALLGAVSIAAAAVAVSPSSMPVADPRAGLGGRLHGHRPASGRRRSAPRPRRSPTVARAGRPRTSPRQSAPPDDRDTHDRAADRTTRPRRPRPTAPTSGSPPRARRATPTAWFAGRTRTRGARPGDRQLVPALGFAREPVPRGLGAERGGAGRHPDDHVGAVGEARRRVRRPGAAGLPAGADRRRHVRRVHHGMGAGGRGLWRPDPDPADARVQRRPGTRGRPASRIRPTSSTSRRGATSTASSSERGRRTSRGSGRSSAATATRVPPIRATTSWTGSARRR